MPRGVATDHLVVNFLQCVELFPHFIGGITSLLGYLDLCPVIHDLMALTIVMFQIRNKVVY